MYFLYLPYWKLWAFLAGCSKIKTNRLNNLENNINIKLKIQEYTYIDSHCLYNNIIYHFITPVILI